MLSTRNEIRKVAYGMFPAFPRVYTVYGGYRFHDIKVCIAQESYLIIQDLWMSSYVPSYDWRT
jgi:hypothetical protein